jgi:chromosome segregation protein
VKHAPGRGAAKVGARAPRRVVHDPRAARLRAEACLSLAALKQGAAVPPQVEVEARLQKLKGDRERLGGVNLRAEEEEAELSAKLEEMERESRRRRNDHAARRASQSEPRGPQAPARGLRHRQRAFQRLFKTLFGGSTRLKLVESDDPLESGSDPRCPPWKRPQVLALLSGGEKALTALALIFAVFLTNPSPICVLDEVDAPSTTPMSIASAC